MGGYKNKEITDTWAHELLFTAVAARLAKKKKRAKFSLLTPQKPQEAVSIRGG